MTAPRNPPIAQHNSEPKQWHRQTPSHPPTEVSQQRMPQGWRRGEGAGPWESPAHISPSKKSFGKKTKPLQAGRGWACVPPPLGVKGPTQRGWGSASSPFPALNYRYEGGVGCSSGQHVQQRLRLQRALIVHLCGTQRSTGSPAPHKKEDHSFGNDITARHDFPDGLQARCSLSLQSPPKAHQIVEGATHPTPIPMNAGFRMQNTKQHIENLTSQLYNIPPAMTKYFIS